MVNLVARRLGSTLMVLWTDKNSLGRKVVATEGLPGARYGREVAPGEWRYEYVRGTATIVFTELRQLSALVKMLYVRDL